MYKRGDPYTYCHKVFGGDVVSNSFVDHRAFDPWLLKRSLKVPNKWYLSHSLAWQGIGSEYQCIGCLYQKSAYNVVKICVQLVITIVQVQDVSDSHLRGEIVGFNCEWLSSKLTISELNVGYIREIIHIPIALTFWMEM